MITVNTGKCELGFISPHRIYEVQTFLGWEQIGFTDELTEEECDSIIESRVLVFKRWKSHTFDHWNLTSARYSFHTLLIKNEIIGRHIVLRKIEHE